MRVYLVFAALAFLAAAINVMVRYSEMPGDPVSHSELLSTRALGLTGTYCKTLAACQRATGGCGTPVNMACASQGNDCGTCSGAPNLNCSFGGTATCIQKPNKTCCSYNTCKYVLHIGAGTCDCSGPPGAAGGVQTDC